MNAILGLGKYLFAVPMAVFGLFHFMNAQGMASMAPGGVVMVYITGIALIAAAVSVFIGKWDKLGTALLGLMLLLFALILHLPGMLDGDQMGTSMFLKDVALAGGAWMYSSSIARDKTVMG